MINVSELPAVRAQLELDVTALKERHAARALAEKQPQFARAPTASGAAPASARPAVAQGKAR